MVAAHAHVVVKVQHQHQHQYIQALFKYLNHQDVSQDSIEIVILNAFQMSLEIHHLLIAHQAFCQMDLEIVFLQQAQFHVHLDSLQEVEAVFLLIQEIPQPP